MVEETVGLGDGVWGEVFFMMIFLYDESAF